MQCQRSGQRWYAVEIFLCHELHHVIDNHSRDLQASNCAKGMSIKPGKATRSKRQLFKTFQKLTVKARSIAAFLLPNLWSRSHAAQRQILSNCHYTERSALTKEGLSNFV